jgi:hypothetical protein
VTYLEFQNFKCQKGGNSNLVGPSFKFENFPVDLINRKAKQDGSSGEIYVPRSESETRRDPENWFTQEVRRAGAER